MKNISTHITYEEATNSPTAKAKGLDNTPNAQQLANMEAVAKYVFEPLRKGLGGNPIRISSFFRSHDTNTAIGGAKKSQHGNGEAIDIVGKHSSNKEIFEYIKDYLPFDQLIWEFGNAENPDWVHVSFSSKHNRRQILKASKNKKGETVYTALNG